MSKVIIHLDRSQGTSGNRKCPSMCLFRQRRRQRLNAWGIERSEDYCGGGPSFSFKTWSNALGGEGDGKEGGNMCYLCCVFVGIRWEETEMRATVVKLSQRCLRTERTGDDTEWKKYKHLTDKCPQVLRVVFLLQVIGGSGTTLYEQAFYQFATSHWIRCERM